MPAFVFRLPYALLDATLWSLITYWAVGFDNSWRFLIFWLFLFLTCAWSVRQPQMPAPQHSKDSITCSIAVY